GSPILLPGVALNAERTAASTAARAPKREGETAIRRAPSTITIGRRKRAAIVDPAGCAVRPARCAPNTVTPGAIATSSSAAGAAAHAIPAAATKAATVLSTGRKSTRMSGENPARNSVRSRPYPRSSDGKRHLDDHALPAGASAVARRGAGGRRDDRVGAGAARPRRGGRRAVFPRRRLSRPRPVPA